MTPTHPPQPLTRNLYREDEAIAALRWCLLKCRAHEAIFWAQELLDSDMREDVLESMMWVWTFAAVIPNPDWLGHFRKLIQEGSNATDDEVLYCLMRLMRGGSPKVCRDMTLPVLLGLGLSEENCLADRVGMPVLSAETAAAAATTATTDKHLLTTARAIQQGKLPFAWSLLRPLWGTEQEEAIWQLLKTFGNQEDTIGLLENAPFWFRRLAAPKWSWPLRAAAVILAVFQPKMPAATWEPPTEWVAARFEWLALPMRYRRIYTPPIECLYWFTARGSIRVNETTEADLQQGLSACLAVSKYWGPRMPATDEARMNFYDRYFPDDIPDEWSAADRLKSHGFGVVPAGEGVRHEILFENALKRWFAGPTIPYRIWHNQEVFLGQLQSALSEKKEFMATLGEAYDAIGVPQRLPARVYEPVKRELIVG